MPVSAPTPPDFEDDPRGAGVRTASATRVESSPGTVEGGPLPRHPIVLVHGLLGFCRQTLTRLLSFAYFQGVEDHLDEAGAEVHAVSLPPIASVEDRALALARALERFPGERVNLVAHSMGGLDARWYVGMLGGADRVASLTTISTPHRGTAVADWGMHRVGRTLSAVRLLRAAGIDPRGFDDLTRAACDERNERLAGRPEVPTFSYGAARPWWAIAPPLSLSFRMLQRAEGPNDGLVSVTSARHGTYLGTLEADHLGATGWHWTPPGIARFDHLAFYLRVAHDLARRGY